MIRGMDASGATLVIPLPLVHWQERVNLIPKAKDKLHGCWRDLPEGKKTSSGKPIIPEYACAGLLSCTACLSAASPPLRLLLAAYAAC